MDKQVLEFRLSDEQALSFIKNLADKCSKHPELKMLYSDRINSLIFY